VKRSVFSAEELGAMNAPEKLADQDDRLSVGGTLNPADYPE
jgi:hypothetical protein